MNTWFKNAVLAGAALAALGLGSPVLSQEPLVVSLGQTDCTQFYVGDPAIGELTVPDGSGKATDGDHFNGLLAVNIKITRGTREEPAMVDAVAIANPLTAAPPEPFGTVILHTGNGNTVGYIFPLGTESVTRLAGPDVSSGIITKLRFCTLGTTAILPPPPTFSACPLSDTNLANSCARSNSVAFLYIDPGSPELGLQPGQPPALCVCSNKVTARDCVPSGLGEPGSCQPQDASGNSLRQIATTNIEEIARIRVNPLCTLHCFSLDGMRLCQQYCLEE